MPENISNIDFSAPRRLNAPARKALRSWNAAACGLLQENWQGLLGSGVQLELRSVDSEIASVCVRSFPDPGYAARLSIGAEKSPALVVFSAQLVQALVADMLGTLADTWPEVRPLTPAESSMVELLFGEIARSLSLAWPQVEPLACELESVIARPLRSRIYSPDEILVRCNVQVVLPLGEEVVSLVFPQTLLTQIGLDEGNVPESTPGTQSPQLRTIAERLPVTLSVELGKAVVSLAEMHRLTPGDVILLDHPLSSPLSGMIAGRVKWLGNACRLGMRQGFRISSVIDE